MASITTRAGKGTPLTNAEVDANFTNLNTELGQKLPLSGGTMTGAITFAAGQTWPTFNQSTTGSSAAVSYTDTRTIAPNTHSSTRLTFGFTSWANNNTAPYADYLHLRGYTDATGGSENLVMFRKDAIGIRVWQQSFGSATAYATYKDVAFTDSNITGSAAKWTTARTLSFTGDVTGSGSVDGSANVATAMTLANSGVTAGVYGANAVIPSITVDAKGRVTNAAGVTPSGTWGISITGNAATATTLQTARTINGISFNGSANIKTSEWFHSDRDFASGTLVTTDINYAVTNGDPFVLEIRGNSYGDLVPYDIQYQGYIYADTIINHGGKSNGTNITGLVAINVGGNLCFWWPRQSYWNGFNVRVYTAYATVAVNRVTSITSTAKPTSTKEVALSANIRQSLHSGNYSSYALPLSGGTMTGALNFAAMDQGAVLQHNGNATQWYGRILSKNSTSDRAAFLGTYAGIAGVFAHNNALNAWADLYVNTVDGSNGGTVRMPSSTLVAGNQVLHAGNYTSYAAPATHYHDRIYNGASGSSNYLLLSSANELEFFNSAGAIQPLYLQYSGDASSLRGPGGNVILHAGNYSSYALPLGGGTLTGVPVLGNRETTVAPGDYVYTRLTVTPPYHTGGPWYLKTHDTSSSAYLDWWYGTSNILQLRHNGDLNAAGAITQAGNQVLHAGNYSSYALPLSGGTLTGFLTVNADMRVGNGANASYIYMSDADHGERIIHNNSNQIGFLTQASAWGAYCDDSGNWTAVGNVTAYSDETLKKDWGALAVDFVERLAALKYGTYTRIDSGDRQAGASAQSMQELLPEVVTRNADGKLSLAYGNAALVSAIELAKRVVRLEAQLAKLIGD